MQHSSDSELDPSKRATSHLNNELNTITDTSTDVVVVNEKIATLVSEKAQTEIQEEQQIAQSVKEGIEVPQVRVKEARKEASVVLNNFENRTARILILTKDLSVFNEGSSAHTRITDLRKRFFEIHIVVLNQIVDSGELSITRLFENVWMYPVNASSEWILSYAAYEVIKEQLYFSGGFRADIIIAEDVSESGLVGWYASKKFERPFELHIYEDFFDATYIGTKKYPFLYKLCASFVLEHATHVRTKTEFQRESVIVNRPELEKTTECIPQYYNINLWKDFEPVIDLHERYPQFKFILLAISSMHVSSHTDELLMGVVSILKQYKTIGLVIVGNGPLRSVIEHQVIELGIKNQVEFEPMPSEVLSHLKTANIFIHLSEEQSDDVLLIQAGVSKIPIITQNKGLGGALFVDDESAYLCDHTDTECIQKNVTRLLNKNIDRRRVALNAYEVVLNRVDQNYETYLDEYAGSIERCIPPIE